MDKNAYERAVGAILAKIAADEDYWKERAKKQDERDEDRDLTSSVNALAALGTLAGVGMSPKDTRGGLLATGASLGGAGGYHAARMLKAPKTLRLLSALAGGITGGAIGYNYGDTIPS